MAGIFEAKGLFYKAGEGSGGGGSDPHDLGYFATQAALEEAYPTAEAGDWAIVGATDTVWVWDSGTSAWVDTETKSGVTSVNGQTGDVVLTATDVGALPDTTPIPDPIQYSSMPTAAASNEGDIVQFIGTTDATYTNGYFYKCVEESGVYSWVQTNVQPMGATINDNATTSLTETWSANKLTNTIGDIETLLAAI